MEVLSLPAAAAPAAAVMSCSAVDLPVPACLAPAAPAPAAALVPPPCAAAVPAEASTSCDGSQASSSSEVELPSAAPAVAPQQPQQQLQQQQQPAAPPPAPQQPDAMPERTHHLLKHCLSQSQRGAALQHFQTSDAREAAKEIARMGQRELQAKFKEVYGSATKSNNNSWLRRKLYEAVGVAPLKANTKGKARKAASSASRKSSAPKDGGAKSRSPKAAPKAKRPAAPPAADHLSCSPYGGYHAVSVLDGYPQLSCETSSDSEDGSGSHGTFPASLHSSAPGTPKGLPFSPSTIFSGQPLAPPAPAMGPTGPGFVPMPVCEQPGSPCGGHWADTPFGTAGPSSFLPAAAHSVPSLESALSGLAPFGRPAELEPPAAAAAAAAPAAPSPLAWEPPCPAADVGCGGCGAGAPWYFGGPGGLHGSSSALDLAGLACQPMDCCQASCEGGPSCCRDDDDDDLLLLRMPNLGGIDTCI